MSQYRALNFYAPESYEGEQEHTAGMGQALLDIKQYCDELMK